MLSLLNLILVQLLDVAVLLMIEVEGLLDSLVPFVGSIHLCLYLLNDVLKLVLEVVHILIRVWVVGIGDSPVLSGFSHLGLKDGGLHKLLLPLDLQVVHPLDYLLHG